MAKPSSNGPDLRIMMMTAKAGKSKRRGRNVRNRYFAKVMLVQALNAKIDALAAGEVPKKLRSPKARYAGQVMRVYANNGSTSK